MYFSVNFSDFRDKQTNVSNKTVWVTQSVRYRLFSVNPSMSYDLPRCTSTISVQSKFRLKFRGESVSAKSILHRLVQVREGNHSFRIFGDCLRNETMFRTNCVPDFVSFFIFPILFRLPDNIFFSEWRLCLITLGTSPTWRWQHCSSWSRNSKYVWKI